MLGYNLDVLVLVIPLLVTARAASHGVQLLERYFEELEHTGDRHQAVRESMSELFLPGAIGILADAAGILVLGVATIPLVRKVAFFASFWGFSNIFTILILVPLLLDVLPTPNVTTHYVPHWLASGLHWVGECCTSRRGRWVVFGIAAVVVVLGVQQAVKVPIGYTEAGIAAAVAGFRLQRFLAPHQPRLRRLQRAGDLPPRRSPQRDEGSSAAGPARQLQPLHARAAAGERHPLYHDPGAAAEQPFSLQRSRVADVSARPEGIGQMLFMYQSSSPSPTIIFQYMDYKARDGQFVVYYKDLEGSTVIEALTRAKRFIAAHPMPHVKFVLAGGSIGLTAALNDEIAYSDRVSTLLILAVVFTLVALSYVSLTAGAMVLMTLIAAGVVSFLYIGLKGVGININTLPVTAVGMGIGVDYILYVVDRIKREYGRLADYDAAIKRAINTSGNGGHVHRHYAGRRRAAVVLDVEPAVLGRDGAVAGAADAHALAGGDNAGAVDLLDYAARVRRARPRTAGGAARLRISRRCAGSVNAGPGDSSRLRMIEETWQWSARADIVR